MKNNVASFTEKEILIFKGVLTLAGGQKTLHSVTVQDIADAAGVGKGTIYDYFPSKEAILAKTVLYSVACANEDAVQAVARQSSFKGKIFSIYDLIMASVDNRLSAFNLMLYMGGMGELREVVHSNKDEFLTANRQSEKLFSEILIFGAKSGEIKFYTDLAYIKMAISANILAVGKATLEKCGDSDYTKIKNDAYKMLIKTLN